MCCNRPELGRTASRPITLGAPGGPVRLVRVLIPTAGLWDGLAYVTGQDVDQWLATRFIRLEE